MRSSLECVGFRFTEKHRKSIIFYYDRSVNDVFLKREKLEEM